MAATLVCTLEAMERGLAVLILPPGCHLTLVLVSHSMRKLLSRLLLPTSVKVNSSVSFFAEEIAAGVAVMGKCYSITELDCSYRALRMTARLRDALLKCGELKSLSVVFSNRCDDVAGMVAEVVKGCKMLEHLDISGSLVGEKGMRELAPALRECTLRSLNLGTNNLKQQGAEALVRALPSSLTYLNLDNNMLGCWGVRSLAAALDQIPHLRELHMHFNHIEGAGVASLGRALVANCARLQTLELQHNRISEKGAADLASALAGSSGWLQVLEVLNLRNNEIGDTGAASLAKAFEVNCARLRTLNLSYNRIANEGAQGVAQALGTCTDVTSLVMNGNNIGTRGLRALGAALGPCRALLYANLASNMLYVDHQDDEEEEGVLPVAASAHPAHLRQLTIAHTPLCFHCIQNVVHQHSRTLVFLDLTDTSFGLRDARALALALQGNATLQRLDLSDNNTLNDECVGVLALQLPSASSLRWLNLEGCVLGERGCEHLALAMPRCSALTDLDLSENRVGPHGATALAGALHACPALAHLRLEHCSLQTAGRRTLESEEHACPGLRLHFC